TQMRRARVLSPVPADARSPPWSAPAGDRGGRRGPLSPPPGALASESSATGGERISRGCECPGSSLASVWWLCICSSLPSALAARRGASTTPNGRRHDPRDRLPAPRSVRDDPDLLWLRDLAVAAVHRVRRHLPPSRRLGVGEGPMDRVDHLASISRRVHLPDC